MKDNRKGNKQPTMDLIKMPEKKMHVNFKEPKDYSIETPQVVINDCSYQLYDGGSLSFVTPKLLAETVDRLKKLEQVASSV